MPRVWSVQHKISNIFPFALNEIWRIIRAQKRAAGSGIFCSYLRETEPKRDEEFVPFPVWPPFSYCKQKQCRQTYCLIPFPIWIKQSVCRWFNISVLWGWTTGLDWVSKGPLLMYLLDAALSASRLYSFSALSVTKFTEITTTWGFPFCGDDKINCQYYYVFIFLCHDLKI